jgi:hypothetical protein
MQKETHIFPVYETKSLADALGRADMPEWKKWLLKKLIPKEFHEIAPQTIVDALPKGVRICSMQVVTEQICTDSAPLCIDIGG